MKKELPDSKIINDEGEEIPAENCSNCIFSHEVPTVDMNGVPLAGQSSLVCMHSPPQLFLVTVPTPGGMQTGIRSQFPGVNNRMFCHQYESDDDMFDLITGEPMND